MNPKPVILCILDGWGEGAPSPDNAIHLARTPVWDALKANYPHGALEASEQHVGLPSGQMGNSEVGHMNIGAGRVVMQDLPRIDAAIADGSLAKNPELVAHIAALKTSGGTCHLMGLLSDGGVHAHIAHIIALANSVAAAGVPVAIHAFLDGRDTPPKSAEAYLATLQSALHANTTIATLSGRYYAMDRDTRWERIAKAYDAMVDADAPKHADAHAALRASYAANITDEFLLPCALTDYAGMRDGDGVLMANFRADRARQLLHALGDADFTGFARSRVVQFAHKLGMVEYSAELYPSYHALFAATSLDDNLGEVMSKAGLTQLRIAETEKYAHVTFFFSGGREAPYAGETRILIPSPKVATYDEKPEMSAYEVTDALIEAMPKHDVIIVNFANTDMVGHTGNMPATIAAIEAVDNCLGKLLHAVEACGGAMLITADHGNAEQMHDDATAQAHTAHTCNVVPLILVDARFKGNSTTLPHGTLADIAPSMLALLGLPQPASMTGQSRIPAAVQSHVA
jgi:2,3-bisphosphoglycerate-independent phosphoglycerate mutase